VLARLKPLLEDDAVLKVGQNLKYDALVSCSAVFAGPIDDTMLMSYVLEGGLHVTHGRAQRAASVAHPITFSEVTGKARTRSVSIACRRKRPNIPPRMPTSPCGWRWS